MKTLFVWFGILVLSAPARAIPQLSYREDYLDSFNQPFQGPKKSDLAKAYADFRSVFESTLGIIERSGFQIRPTKLNVILSTRTSRPALLEGCLEDRGCELTIAIGDDFGGAGFTRRHEVFDRQNLAAILLRLGNHVPNDRSVDYHFASFNAKGIDFVFEENFLSGLESYPDRNVESLDYLMEIRSRVENISHNSPANPQYKEVVLDLNPLPTFPSYFLTTQGHCGIYLLAPGQNLEKTLVGIGDHNCAPFGK